jgi:hypothetical protein
LIEIDGDGVMTGFRIEKRVNDDDDDGTCVLDEMVPFEFRRTKALAEIQQESVQTKQSKDGVLDFGVNLTIMVQYWFRFDNATCETLLCCALCCCVLVVVK